MTTSKIAQMASLLSSPELLNTQKQSQSTNFVFGAFLSQTAGGRNQEFFSCETAGQSPSQADTVKQAAYEKESAKSGYRESSISNSEALDNQKKLPEDVQDKLEAFEKQVKEAVAESLGVSEEEITQQMEVLGLTVMDLMDPSKLAGLVMELTGSEDIGGLLLSQDFQQILGQVGAFVQDLAAQLNLTPKEMNQLLLQIENLPATDDVQNQLPQDLEEMPTDQMEEMPAADLAANPATETNAEIAQTVVQDPDKETELPQDSVQEAADSEEKQQVVNTVQETEGQEEAGENASEEESFSELTEGSKENSKAEGHQDHVTYQTTTQTVNQGQTVEVTQTIVQAKVNVEDILRQVSQMTRVVVGNAESTIEMQLNPANLGKVYLQVVSREGVITAQLAAQNEAVKEALESQLVVLKENMNQQGLKVEAIEVTIASHEFERNLEENQQNSQREQQEAQAQKSGRRNLTRSSLGEMEGLMSEEESLAAKIMSERGNSMDVTA